MTIHSLPATAVCPRRSSSPSLAALAVRSCEPRSLRRLRRWPVPGVIVLQVLLTASPALAQGWSGVIADLSAPPTEGMRGPEVAADTVGNAIAIFRPSFSRGIEVAHFNRAAGTWSSPVRLAAEVPIGQPLIGMDAAGNAIAIWNRPLPESDVRVARFDAASRSWGAPSTLLVPSAGSSVFSIVEHQMAVGQDGHAVVAWALRTSGQSSQWTVQAMTYSPITGVWSAPTTLSAPASFEVKPVVAIGRAGRAVVLWYQSGSLGVQAAQFASGSWGSTTSVGDTASTSELRVVMDQQDNVTGLWLAANTAPIRSMRYSAASGTWGTATQLTASGIYPHLTVDSAGNVTAAWTTTVSGNLGTRRYADGAWGAESTIPGSPAGTRPRLIADAQGNVTAVWSERSLMRSARYSPAAAAWGAAVDVSRLNEAGFRASYDQKLAVDLAGNVTVVWSQIPRQDIRIHSIQTTRWLAAGSSEASAPTGLQSTVTGLQVALSWNAPFTGPRPTSYLVEAGSATGLADLAQFDTGSSATTLAVNAPPGTYYLRVRARVGGTTSGPSNEVQVIARNTPCVVPAPPMSLTNTTAGTSVVLSWQAAAGATNYVLQAGSAPGQSNIAALSLTGTTLSTAAPPGTYYVRVLAQSACGTSAPSNETIVSVACAAPSAPGTLSATRTGNIVTITWGAASGASAGYVLEVGSAPGATNLGLFPTASTSLTATAPPGTYYVRVRARGGCGSGPATNEVVVTVP